MSIVTVRDRKVHATLTRDSDFTLCRRLVQPGLLKQHWPEGAERPTGTVTCFACQKAELGTRWRGHGPRVVYDTGVSQDAGGSWHVCAGGQEILFTSDREYALRALKRAIERELAEGA